MAYMSVCMKSISSVLRSGQVSSCVARSVLQSPASAAGCLSARRLLQTSALLRSDDYGDGGYGRRRGDFDNGGGYGGGRRINSFYDDISSGMKETPSQSQSLNTKKNIPLEKDLFKPTEELSQRSAEDNKKFLEENNMILQGEDLPPAIQKFSEQEFPEGFQQKLEKFPSPTPIQAQGWSIALSGRDFIGIGQTGSGKTLGYVLPCLTHVLHHGARYRANGVGHDDAPLALVLAPTRELVQQIMQVAAEYARGSGVEVVSMFGGASKDVQIRNFTQRRAQIVVGCPGRLLDFMQQGELHFGRCGFVVLDEADRMLDMGFEPQIRQLIDACREDRQTLMWSATWPQDVRELAKDFLHKPVQLSVGSTELRANPDIRQLIDVVNTADKFERLKHLLKKLLDNNPKEQMMVFCETKRMADKVTDNLRRAGFSAGAIHGDKSQRARDEVLNAFRRGRVNVLTATDVAARGIDVPSLGCVVNFEMPSNVESYVHRIGRTGRCGNEGLAYSLVTTGDANVVRPLIKVLKDAGQPVSTQLQALAASASASASGTRSGYGGNRGSGYHGNRGGYGGNRGGYGGNRGGYGGNRGGYGGNRGGGRRNRYDDYDDY